MTCGYPREVMIHGVGNIGHKNQFKALEVDQDIVEQDNMDFVGRDDLF